MQREHENAARMAESQETVERARMLQLNEAYNDSTANTTMDIVGIVSVKPKTDCTDLTRY